jgi:hypothetical protein
MISVISVYQDAARDNVNKDENGTLSYEKFNRMSRRAENRMIDFLSGDVSGQKPPVPDSIQKNRDWIAPLVTEAKLPVKTGKIDWPKDYYGYHNMYLISNKIGCDDEHSELCNIAIELLSGQKFYNRCNTYIKELKPSLKKPIAKQVGKSFHFAPSDLGNVGLEYIRYSKYGNIVSSIDPIYNKPVADANLSQDYEWDEYARELLIWFITDTFAISTRDASLKAANASTGKLVRDTQ